MTTYQVRLSVFEGPLDLLLYLIQRNELDITIVSLAQVTEQYLDYLATLDVPDPDNLASFLVIAARLLLIKSRVLLPRPPQPTGGEEEDEGEDLVQLLRAYKQFKEVGQWLQERDRQGLRSYNRTAPPPPIRVAFHLEGVSLSELQQAMRRVLQATASVPESEKVAPPAISITDKIGLIEERLSRGGWLRFGALFERAQMKTEIIVTFLALLELLKQRRIRVQQQVPFGEIVILPLVAGGGEQG